jgi:TRAP-type C4-dicarboxylate transport system substrate-binding protein
VENRRSILKEVKAMKKLVLVSFIVVLMVGLIFCGLTKPTQSLSAEVFAAPKPAKPIVVKFGTDIPPGLAPVVGVEWWAKEVTKRTEGRVKIEIYPARSLIPVKGAPEAVRTRVADMYFAAINTYRDTFPLASVTGLPGAGFPDDTLEANTAHTEAFFELLAKYPAVAEEFKNFGDVFLYVIYSESYLFFKDKKVHVPADLGGLKVGCGGVRLELMEKLDVATVFDAPPMAYEKLQTGVTDATFAALSAAHDFNLFEVTDYVLDVPFGGSGMVTIVNKDTWNKISPQDRQLMKDLAPEAARMSNQAIADLTRQSWQEVKDLGMKVTATEQERSLWEKQFEVLWEEWIAGNEAAGAKEAREIFNYWKGKADKAWSKYK